VRRRPAWSWSTTTAASPPGGGCSPRSDDRPTSARFEDFRRPLHHPFATRRFASNIELTPEGAHAAELRSLPRPSALREPVKWPSRSRDGAEALGLGAARDLLEHFPRDLQDLGEVRQLAELRVGEKGTVSVEVRSVSVKPMRDRRRKLVQARIADESGPAMAVWFNQPWVADRLAVGSQVLLHGTVKPRHQFHVERYELGEGAGSNGFGLISVYPATENLSREQIRKKVAAVRPLARHVVEPLPGLLRARERLADRPAALDAIHFPEEEEDRPLARERLAFEELLMLELALGARRRARREGARAAPLPADGRLVDSWLDALPFEPTGDQRAAFAEIDRDLAGERPMQRLLMGEVGSGKTAVCLHAMLRALENGRQAVLMAPTETLAEQHLATLDRLLGGLVPVALLTGSTPARRRREIHDRLRTGELGLVVGTHALIEPTVEFRALGLAVVDEQHRFGVRQRAALDAKAPKGLAPHTLHMTATPIPRTLQLTAYGDLDATTLRELPAGRGPVETYVVDGARARARAYERAREEIARGRQVFVVCPLVEESEALQAKAATREAERLARTEFRDQRVELIHGQLPSSRKAEAMAAFASAEADVLVATSVIEVGIDVPNATVMLIEAAERYGLSQLHQLRGRIGRGEHASLCVLFGDPAQPRLEALARERDGFRLAEVDLELRGAGEVLGTRQHGLPQFRLARLPEDLPLLQRARAAATELLERDPELSQPEHVLLRAATVERFGSELDPIPA
jgi:ATP-dependent DNA helicase RecG